MKKEDVRFKKYDTTQSLITKAGGFLFWIKNWFIITYSVIIAFAATIYCPAILITNILILFGFIFIDLIKKTFHVDASGDTCTIENNIHSSILGNDTFPSDNQLGQRHVIQTVDPSRLKSFLFQPGKCHKITFYELILFSPLERFLCYHAFQKQSIQ